MVLGLLPAWGASHAGSLTYDSRIAGWGEVYRVKDGDTYIINVRDNSVYADLQGRIGNKKEQGHFNPKYRSIVVRLANVDTPESVHPDTSRNTDAGRAASRVAAQMLEGMPVQFICFGFGSYGRLICSVEVSGLDVGLQLISGGHGEYMTRYGAHPYLHQLYLRAARR